MPKHTPVEIQEGPYRGFFMAADDRGRDSRLGRRAMTEAELYNYRQEFERSQGTRPLAMPRSAKKLDKKPPEPPPEPEEALVYA